jgi:hypothetical protein
MRPRFLTFFRMLADVTAPQMGSQTIVQTEPQSADVYRAQILRVGVLSCYLIPVILVFLGCGKPAPEYLHVSPQEEASLMATNRQAIHSLVQRWARDWTSLPDADSRLRELMTWRLNAEAVRSTQAALVGSSAPEEGLDTPTKAQFGEVVASVANMDPRLGWICSIAATNQLGGRVLAMALLASMEILDESDTNPRGREWSTKTKASLRALLAADVGQPGLQAGAAVETSQWICGVYVGTSSAYDMTGDDGKPIFYFGEKVRVPAVKKTIQIDRGGDTLMLREVSTEGTTVLSTAPLRITESSSSKVVIDTKFENGSGGVPTQIIISDGDLVIRQHKSPATTLRRIERF